MAIVLALPRLYDAVAARFAREGVDVPMAFGWLAASQQLRSSRRIVWSPGAPSGSLGAVRGPLYTGSGPRQLATVEEACTVEITAIEAQSATDERAQYQAAHELFEAWLRAVHLEAHGTYKVASVDWLSGARGRRAGASIRVVLTVQAPVVDTAVSISASDLGAELDLDALDQTDTIEVPPAA